MAQVLSCSHVRQKAEQIIICGDFSLEDDIDLQQNGIKLLVNRIQSLVNSSLSDAEVEDLYWNLRAISGRRGFEVTRTSGTGGVTSPQTHVDLLFVLHENEYLLPNKAGSCISIPHKNMYYILYKKHDPDVNTHPIVITTIAPPKPGGLFLLNGHAVD